MQVTKRNGTKEPRDINKIHKQTQWACEGLDVSQSELEMAANLMFFDGMRTSQIHDSMIQAAAGLITVENQDYTFVAARLLALKLYKESWGGITYPPLSAYLAMGVEQGKLNPVMCGPKIPETAAGLFDINALNNAIRPERDLKFAYLGLQTLADRYLIRNTAREIIELPQHMWMRVAMGLALLEDNPTARAIEFYDVLSQFEFINSTPTLFNSGTKHSQLASCFLNTVTDSLDADDLTAENFTWNRYASIYGTIQECANLSKYAGGIGTDWTPVRHAGCYIKGTDGTSSGIVPYLKVYNDTAVAVNQGGKRQGSFAPFLEPWHPDFYAFADLKKESGDDRQRAHDIYPAAWMNDLLMERKDTPGAVWSFFSPAEYPELHELHGAAFKARYEELEAAGKFVRQVPAIDVWKKILGALFETGHPWITFKDECNRRSPQQHDGVVHSSNLCTEITLNSKKDETAVCNIGSIGLAAHLSVNMDGTYGIDFGKLRRTVRTAMRMLDNTIDLNFYPSERAKRSNMRHRPVGLGLMGYTEMLVALGVDWESQEHLELADLITEHYSYYAIEASCDMSRERGAYESFPGSLWSQGILPIDTAKQEAKDLTKRAYSCDWDSLRKNVVVYGMRNSNTMAIAPTATISNIIGTTATIEPVFMRSVAKKNMSGVFLVIDPALRYGRPELCKEAFFIAPEWVIDACGVRQKWIDQAQSLNIFTPAGVKGKQLDGYYTRAWRVGCKTTYYLRGQSAVMKKEMGEKKPEVAPVVEEPENKLCSLDNPDCESCQ
jgi:ribonucleoside-diphosphate reductase alpha chain